ncbi:MAG TPA: methyltransferase domain-containing protein [Longimicrobiales bacterium]|nr:methyltransferase domain-containing protein [Longimicrobiales bacterium]
MTVIGQDKESERRFYDELFRKRRRFDQFNDDIYRRIAREARAGTDGSQVLDLGCGSGTQALCLMDEGFSVVAADLSIEAVRVAEAGARQADRTLPVINADAERLPLADASLDACVCGLLLHHFTNLEAVAAELRRVVKPGGVVVAIDANAHNPPTWMFLNVVHRLRPLARLTPNQRALRSSEIRQTFGRAGFGEFRFSSVTSELRRDWLGDSLGARLNYYSRAALLGVSNAVLPQIGRGNMLLSVFRRAP